MELRRAATDLLLRSSCPFAKHVNGGSVCSKTVRRLAHRRATWNPSHRSAPSSILARTLHTTRDTPQQAAAAKKEDEPDEDASRHPKQSAPDSLPESTQRPQHFEQKAQVATNFLQGTPDPTIPSPSSSSSSSPSSSSSTAAAAAAPSNPANETIISPTRRQNLNPLGSNPELSHHFDALRRKQEIPNDSKRPKPKDAKSSFDDMMAALGQYQRGEGAAYLRQNADIPTTTPPPSYLRKSNNRADASRMLDPSAGWARFGMSPSPDGQNRVVNFAEPDIGPPPFRIDPYLARSVDVDPDRGMDLARAVKALDVRCGINNVRQDLQRQRYHERPGLKRKRLASQRWRRRFKEGFNETIRRVKEIRRQGW